MSEKLRDSSKAAENGDPNLLVGVEPTAGAVGNAGGKEVSVFLEPVNQVDVQQPGPDDPNDSKVAEEGGKEDMFVDCSDEIEISENQQNSEGKDTQFKQLKNETQVRDMLTEMQNLCDKLEKTVAEKNKVTQDYEEQRAALKGELMHLHCQLKAMNVQQPISSKKIDGSIYQYYTPEVGEEDEKDLASDISLLEMINECSKLLGNALVQRSQTECSSRDLQAALQIKDLEIEDLNSNVTEFSVSHDVILSYLSSQHDTISRSFEVQLETYGNIEEIANRILASLPMIVHEGGLSDKSIGEKYSHVEESFSILVAKYDQFLSEIDQVRQCLTEIAPDIIMEDEVDIFCKARSKLHEFKSTEVDFDKKLSHLEGQKMKLVEEVDNNKAIIGSANAQIAKINAELEQEKTKYANTKEKLSLAVTKGKALVRQRDSLKQALDDKASELEKCLIELQEKSHALEVAEQSKDLLLKSEYLAASLQESLMQKDLTLQKCEEILSVAARSEEIQSLDISEKLKWLADERNALKSQALEFHKLSDALSSISFPEHVPSDELDTQVKWLGQSFHLGKEEALKLQNEMAAIREAAREEIDRITTSFLAKTLEKYYIQEELEDLRCKYEGIVELEYKIALEKDQMVSILLKESGITIEDEEGVNFIQPGVAGIIDKCIAKIREEAWESLKSSQVVQVEVFERLQSLLYTQDQEVKLYADLLEEEKQDRAEMNRLSSKLLVVTQALGALKDEKASLKKELETSEEKAVLLREKLSMAVKKGKGLVQERETLKGIVDGKNIEIERLKSDLQEVEAACNDFKDQIKKLLADVDCIPKLEANLAANEDQRNQLEQFLVESNSMLQRMIECIDGVVLPGDLVLKDPVEKLKWLAGYLSDCQAAKAQAHKELGIVRNEASTLASKMVEAETAVKSMENTLADAENRISELLEEKKGLEVAKIQVEKELQKAMEEIGSLHSTFTEVSVTSKSHEDALLLAEENISKLVDEKEGALVSRAAAEMELQKLKEENSMYLRKLAEADKTVQSLEDAFSKAQRSYSLLSEETHKAQIDRGDMEDELKKLKAEADSLARNLSDTSMTIKSLEDTLANAENNISHLVKENRNAEQENLALNSKLNACLQELAGTHGSFKNRFLELSGQFTSLQLLLRDDTLSSLLQQSFEKKIESLKDMDLLLRETRDYMSEIDSEVLQNYPAKEDDSSFSTVAPADLNGVLSTEIADSDMNAEDDGYIISRVGKIVEGFHSRNKTLANKIEGFSRLADNLISAMLKRLRVTKDGVIVALELLKSLKQKVNDFEMDRQAHESTISILESDIKLLLSVCTEASRELESEFQHNLMELTSTPLAGNLTERFSMESGELSGNALVDREQVIDGCKHQQIAENLLVSVRHNRHLSKQIQDIKNMMVTTVEDLQNELKETKITCKKHLEERDLNQHQISKLETDLGELQNLCHEMSLKVDDYRAREAMLKEREAGLSAAHSTSLMELHEFHAFPLSASQMRSLFDKINSIDTSSTESEFDYLETYDSAIVRKLFYVVDTFTGLHHQINSKARERQDLLSRLEKQVLEIEHLKEELDQHARDKQESERMKNELVSGLEDIIQKLGGDEQVQVQKAAHVSGLLPVLEKMVMASIAESENLKSKTEELNSKLLGTQRLVDDLSNKVKLLEDFNQAMVNNAQEIVNEKGNFESSSLSTHSEISEIQEPGPVGNNKIIASVPTAAHPRTLRKDSSDHLAINVDPESERLIDKEQDDEDKGHVFKSLSTSGLIPRQGKMIADRIDGIWVSGGRALMSHPRSRLGLLAYSLFLHIWLLGTIL